jgi:predicted nucleic acid-binding Zn ribbon protein
VLDHLSALNAKISYVNDLDTTSETLCIWLGIETQKGLSVTGAVVREKVLQSHSHCVGCGREEKANFCASKGWFTKVEKCMQREQVNILIYDLIFI